jgi:hypothetical protein
MKKSLIQLISLSLIIILSSCESDSTGNDMQAASGDKAGEITATNQEDTKVKASNQTPKSQGSDELTESDSPKNQGGVQINDPKTPDPVLVDESPVLDELTRDEVIDVVIDETEPDTYDFHAYEKLDAFLKKYVTYSGHVNYASIKANKAELTAITKEFENNFPDGDFSYTQKLSYWINAYNVYTIKLIVDNYPTTSITKITAKPWNKKFIKLGGTTYSLNNLENDIIRKRFNEPRIHFALNCASKSCPVHSPRRSFMDSLHLKPNVF